MSDTAFVIPKGDPAADALVVLTSAEADRVLTIQDRILAAARSATEAHKSALARIADLEAEKADLQARIAGLEAKVADTVDPAVIRAALDDLAAAIAPHSAAVPTQG